MSFMLLFRPLKRFEFMRRESLNRIVLGSLLMAV